MGPQLATTALQLPLGSRRLALSCAFVALLLAAPVRSAAAQSSAGTEADDRLAHGLELYKDGDYDGASSEFADAYQLDERPDILFAWAQAARMAGRCKLAAKLYERFIESSPSEEDARAARQARSMCRDREPPPPLVEEDLPPRHLEDTRRSERKKKKKRKRLAARVGEDEELLDGYEPADSSPRGARATVTAEADAARLSRRVVFARVHVNLARREAVAAPGFSLRMGASWRMFGSALLGGNFGFEPGVELALGKARVRPYVSVALPVFFVNGTRPGVRGGAGLRMGGSLAVAVELGGSYALSVPEGTTRTVLLGSIALERSF